MSQDELIVEAVKRTAASGLAKVRFEQAYALPTLDREREARASPWRRSGIKGGLDWAIDKATDVWLKSLEARAGQVLQGEGYLDAGARLCAIDYGAYAQLIDGSRRWDGRSGRATATLSEVPVSAPNPIWLIDLLRGVTEATGVGSEFAAGQTCQHLRARTDLSLVSAATPDRTPLPAGECFENLGATPVELWLGADGHVRRIRYECALLGSGSSISSLELIELGVTSITLDRSRLPLFKGPKADGLRRRSWYRWWPRT